MKKTHGINNLPLDDIYNAVGRKFKCTVSSDNTIEYPDDLSQIDIDKINVVLYPDQADWETKLSALPLAQQNVWRKLLQRLGELP